MARELVKKDEQFVSPSYLRYYPLCIDTANDCIVKDVDGNEYIDFNAGIACMNVGHNNPMVVEAIKAQCSRFLHYSNTDFYYKEAINLAEKLSEITPGECRKKTFFGNSGTEAVEAGLNLQGGTLENLCLLGSSVVFMVVRWVRWLSPPAKQFRDDPSLL